jgi:beta-aspartyl-dipeptidase (metallo-type)
MLAGTTTVIGCVGVDQEGRDLQSLLAKTRSLEFRGMTARMFTGGFDWRNTLTGSIIKDLFIVDNVLGAKVAISDRRSFHPTQDELNRLIAEAMHGGLLTGKAGVVQVHVGDLANGITPLINAVKETGVPIKHVLPTHFNRNELLMEQALEWVRMGGVVDVTPSIGPPEFNRAMRSVEAVTNLLSARIPIDQITVSTDANGVSTIHGFDKVERVPIDLLHKEFKELVLGKGLTITNALKPVTSNVARVLKMERKGIITEGADADLLLLDPKTLKLELVMARGKVVIQDGKMTRMQKLDV